MWNNFAKFSFKLFGLTPILLYTISKTPKTKKEKITFI